jgi:Flp pilus assembly protein TadG
MRRREEFWRGERGAVAPMMAMLLVVLVGISGFAIDIGHVMWIQRQLQTSADAAALAGAQKVVDDPGNAISFATSYGAQSGGKNAFLAGSVSTNAVLKCVTSVSFPKCTAGSGTYNAIQVTQQATVPMWFSQVLGIPNMTVKTKATASAKGGSAQSLDVMIVLDATASMNDTDNACTVPAGWLPPKTTKKKIHCAKYGVYQILAALNPALDQVGLMVFPGFATQNLANTWHTCSPATTNPDKTHPLLADYTSYNATTPSAPYYMVSTLSDTYKTSGSKDLDPTSDLAIAAGGGSCGQSGGLQAVGGKGTYFAQAIVAAQDKLTTDGNSHSQKVIVLLSDGDAGSSNISTSLKNNQCQQAISAAKDAAAAKTWVYAIAYGATTSGGCSTDKTSYPGVSMAYLSPCDTMSNIASSASKFYSDGANSCSAGAGHTDANLSNLFGDIVMSLTEPRLISNDAT